MCIWYPGGGSESHNDENHPTSTVHYIMEDDFAPRYVRIYPGVNSRAELVTLAPGLRLERAVGSGITIIPPSQLHFLANENAELAGRSQ